MGSFPLTPYQPCHQKYSSEQELSVHNHKKDTGNVELEPFGNQYLHWEGKPPHPKVRNICLGTNLVETHKDNHNSNVDSQMR